MKTWKQINSKRIKHIRYGERLFIRLYASLRNDLKKKLANAQTVEDVRIIAEKYEASIEKVQKSYERLYINTALPFAKNTYSGLKKESKKDFNTTDRNNRWVRSILKYVQTGCGKLITEVIKNQYAGVQSNARKAIQRAAIEGWGARETANELISLQGKMDSYKALRIARTETMRASNEGMMIGAKESGVEVQKVWLATDDDRTRDYDTGDFSHRNMDNVAVDMNQPFDVDGEKLDYPGDPEGSQGNTINCRCAVAFEPKDNPFN